MSNASLTSAPTQQQTHTLSDILRWAVDHHYAIALWRLPHQQTRHIILSRQHQWLKADTTLEELTAGFIFAPFDKSKDRIFLPADLVFRLDDTGLLSPEQPAEIRAHQWLQDQQQHQGNTSPTSPNTPAYHAAPAATQGTARAQYIALVQAAIAAIEQGMLEKVVPSRVKEVELPTTFDVPSAYLRLCAQAPHALVSFVSIPETGTWMGATPEILVSVEDKRIFRTVALAGTQRYHEGTNLKHVAWTQKEIEEQALVERYIISCFKKIRLREYDEQGPKTSIAGNLMHLRSDFTVDMQATNFPQLGTVMLELLHPTSAVCGMPLDAARDFLARHEGYDRQFYAGYLGPVNYDRDTHLFVNLRCMQLLTGKALLYAGAGVTIDSVPEQEWEETELKTLTASRSLA